MRDIALSGWGQTTDAMRDYAPALAYGDLPDVDALWRELARTPTPDVAYGWSLGGQLLVRAIAAGIVRPRVLVLIATPFCWIAADDHPGFPSEDVEGLFYGYDTDASTFLGRFRALVTQGHAQPREVVRRLPITTAVHWRSWLRELENFSCKSVDFQNFPKTLIVHGEDDAVIHPQNAARFSRIITQAETWRLPGQGHAPHLMPEVRDRIQAWVGNA